MSAFDIVIANGRIVDGCGNPWFRGDIGIRGRRVVRRGRAGHAAWRAASSTPPTAM